LDGDREPSSEVDAQNHRPLVLQRRAEVLAALGIQKEFDCRATEQVDRDGTNLQAQLSFNGQAEEVTSHVPGEVPVRVQLLIPDPTPSLQISYTNPYRERPGRGRHVELHADGIAGGGRPFDRVLPKLLGPNLANVDSDRAGRLSMPMGGAKAEGKDSDHQDPPAATHGSA
jgi:hypothetical protein